MRRKAHNLMWPGKPYVEERLASQSQSFQRAGSLRQPPRGVMQFMRPKHIESTHSQNRLHQLPKRGVEGYNPMKPALNPGNAASPLSPRLANVAMPGANLGGLSVPPIFGTVSHGATVRPNVQHSVPARQLYNAGVRYEQGKPVKDVIHAFEKK